MVIKALKALNVKTIAIADIDILNKKNKFKEITDSLGVNWDTLEVDWKERLGATHDLRLEKMCF